MLRALLKKSGGSIEQVLLAMKGSEYPDPEYAKYGEVRLVQIGDLNTQPCGTLHVNETSEIQCFAVLYAEKTARGTKIYVACSFAAVNRLRQAALTEQKLCHLLSGTRDTLADSVQNLQETGRKQKKDLEAAHKELAAFQAEKLLADPEPVIVLDHTDAGMLVRNEDEADKRLVHLQLTAASRPVGKALRDSRRRFSDRCFAGFSEAERRQYLELTDRILDNLLETA